MHIEHGIMMVWFAAILALTACGNKEATSTGAVISQAAMDVVTPYVAPLAPVAVVDDKPLPNRKPVDDSCYVVPGCTSAIAKLEKEWNK
jgi:hypothetical protein